MKLGLIIFYNIFNYVEGTVADPGEDATGANASPSKIQKDNCLSHFLKVFLVLYTVSVLEILLSIPQSLVGKNLYKSPNN